MKTFLVNILVFFYIYPILFVSFPVSTRVLFGVLGFVWFFLCLCQTKTFFQLNKRIMSFLAFLFSIGFISFVSIVISETTDIEFIKYVISMLTILFASFFVVKVLKKLEYKLDFKAISELIVNIILIQLTTAFLMFLIPEFRDVLLGIQRFSPDDIERMSTILELKIVGFGTMFFGAGVINGFGLILISILIRNFIVHSKQVMLLAIKFVIIFVVGIMMARTTIIGGLLGLVLIFMPKDFRANMAMPRKIIFFIISIILIPSILILALYFAVPKVFEMLVPVIEFAFENFINYYNSGQGDSVSTNELKEMYIFPETLKTWIIGDGFWSNPRGSGYYMAIDVGFLRLIYYFGLIGFMSYIAYQYFLIKISFTYLNQDIIKYAVFFYFLILNLKGFTDLSSLLFLYYSGNFFRFAKNTNCYFLPQKHLFAPMPVA